MLSSAALYQLISSYNYAGLLGENILLMSQRFSEHLVLRRSTVLSSQSYTYYFSSWLSLGNCYTLIPHMLKYIHTYICFYHFLVSQHQYIYHEFIHTQTQTNTDINPRVCACAGVHADTRTQTHTHTRALLQIHTHADTHTCILILQYLNFCYFQIHSEFVYLLSGHRFPTGSVSSLSIFSSTPGDLDIRSSFLEF